MVVLSRYCFEVGGVNQAALKVDVAVACIAIAEEAVAAGNRLTVHTHDVLVAGKGADQHHQAALGQMEIGDQHVDQLELKARRNENACVAASLACLGPALQRAHGGSAHSHNTAAARLAVGDGLLRRGGYLVPLAVHLVLGQVLRFHRLEGASTHMQCHMRPLHTHGVELCK